MRLLRVTTIFGVVGLAAFVGGEASAFAQSGRADQGPSFQVVESKNDMQHVTFADDVLLKAVLQPGQASVVARGGPVRTPLVRPRTHFVPELLKSIENL